ncbi:hypothetical protein A7U60_g8875 [Sanghuangporus baumii]|uniref:Uncharacterized protein n=1 Tax=Sanghuangporus baumii TaxID=108892 RepID=A0A9Q5N849_SANBA|nr:hypothetical protein A7U60_g8875 [Sanghuangporus baumii]
MRNRAPNTRPAPQAPGPTPPQHALSANAPPSHPCQQKSYPRVQQNQEFGYSASQVHSQVPSGFLRGSAPVVSVQPQLPAGQARRSSQANTLPINVPSQSQPPLSIDVRQYPSRSVVSTAATQPDPDSDFAYRGRLVGAPDQIGRGVEREVSHTSNLHHGTHAPEATNNAFQTQAVAQSQTLGQNQQLNVAVQRQTFATKTTSGVTESGRTLVEQSLSEPTSSDAAYAVADRHASYILARSYPSLNSFYEVQKGVLRDELLRLNGTHLQALNELHEARCRAASAEQDAKEKQEAALHASETIISKALKWKESLEDVRRKYAILQEQHTRLAQIALELNKQAKADSSEALIAALKGRVDYLETRLKKYEDVEPGLSNTNIPNAVKVELDSDSNGTTFSSRDQHIAGSDEDGHESNKQRLQKIVVNLLERNSVGKATVDIEPTKSEPLGANAEAKSHKASYIIDLTIDASGRDQAQEASFDQTLAEPACHPLSDSGPSVASSGSELEQTLPSDTISLKNPLFLSTSDGQKRNLEGDNDMSRARKRVRSNSSSSPRPPLEVVGVLENSAQMQNTRDSHDARSSSLAHSGRHDSTFLNNLDTGKGHAPVTILSADGLKRIFYSARCAIAGARECRFCVMECELNIREADKKRIFPAITTNDELIDHAVSDHYSSVSHMLQMDRTAVLQTFASILEAA